MKKTGCLQTQILNNVYNGTWNTESIAIAGLSLKNWLKK